jgi:hypothetical protein
LPGFYVFGNVKVHQPLWLSSYLLSSQGLDEAYGEAEPDYSLDRIKIPNPEYRS